MGLSGELKRGRFFRSLGSRERNIYLCEGLFWSRMKKGKAVAASSSLFGRLQKLGEVYTGRGG